jgi:serine/threonine protein kinase
MEGHILYILRETVLGLKYLHDNHQIHRDVKGARADASRFRRLACRCSAGGNAGTGAAPPNPSALA